MERTDMAPQESWTPYGLEAIRIRHLRRRRFALFAILILASLIITTLVSSGANKTTQIFSNGKLASEQGGDNSQISINFDTAQKPKDGPVTVAISPGRVTLADTSQAAQAPAVTRAALPPFSTGDALNWNYYLLLYGPWALLGLALLFLAKRKGKSHEINYGVFKGAMPLEMISSAARGQIFTTREARQSLFGKRAEDHLPEHVVRVPQEGDA
jgi:hypothetical protein